jgi:hypothetical protein
MAKENDLISSLTRGFPKGIKINKTIPVDSDLIGIMHNKLREVIENEGYKYHDIINELKVIEDDVYTLIKLDLYRDAVLLSAESQDTGKAKQMIAEIEKLIRDL